MSPANAAHIPYTPSPILTQHAPAASLAELRGRDLLTLTQLSPACVLELLTSAARLKANPQQARTLLAGRALILIFEKASLRTRITFEAGIAKLGGHAIYMDHSVQRLGVRESVKDYGKNLERWLDAIVARVYSQSVIEELAEHADVPVINALSDRYHPCQALADVLTLWELAHTLRVASHAPATPDQRLRIAYVGDGNNVCHSLMHACTMLGIDTTVITPKGFAPLPDVVAECATFAKASGATLTVTTKLAAIEAHHAVYTDVWVSMGQADEEGKRMKVFSPYQVDGDLMAQASKGLSPSWGNAKFMHCLPARRGVEVTDDVIDSTDSLVYDQAENRLHAQNALLAAILE